MADEVGNRVPGRDEVVADISTRRIAVVADGAVTALHELLTSTNPAVAALTQVRLGEARPRTAAADPIALGWAVNEPMAGRGSVTLTPSGTLVARLVEDWMRSVARDTLMGFEMRTPVIYRWGSGGSELADLAGTFDERIFHTIDGGAQDLIVRYSADPGLLGFLQGSMVPCSEAPQRLFEIGVAMRRNRPGERKPIERLDSFVLGDHHTICGCREDALKEYRDVFARQVHTLREWGAHWAVEFTTTEDDLAWSRPLMTSCAAALGAPVLVEVLSHRKHYWGLKHVFYDERVTRSFSLQWDDQNAARYDITTDTGGSPVILHAALASIERWLMYAARSVAVPTNEPDSSWWFRPVALRILPVSPDDVQAAEAAARALSSSMRVDVDDRSWTLGRRVRSAIAERPALIGIVGPNERSTGTITLRGVHSASQPLSIDAVRALAPRPPGGRELPHHPLPHMLRRSERWERLAP